MNGLLSAGVYVPRYRLDRAEIRAILGAGGGKGSRAVASFDEDSVSMGVEAGRRALVGVASRPEQLFFATPAPPYLDKSNAAVVHAALDLDRSAFAVDFGASPRSGLGAVLAAAQAPAPTLAVISDLRTGRPGSSDESNGGDSAAALLFGPGSPETPVLARILAVASTTEEFLDRWRVPGSGYSRTWEERFGEHVYGSLADEAFGAALKRSDRTAGDIDHLVVCGLAERATAAFARSCGVRREAIVDNRLSSIGNTGAAQPAVQLVDVLDRAQPGDVVAIVQLADGATAVLLEVTEAILGRRPEPSVARQVESGAPVAYPTLLSWRGFLDREPPRRPDPEPPAAPPAHRSGAYKLAFKAARCAACGTVNIPPSRVCFQCSAVDDMQPVAMSSVAGTVATFTVDRLAHTPSPPMIAVVVDFDGGGRFRCELADSSPEDIAIGSRVELTFRRLLTADGVHNYFWKAKPILSARREESP